MILVFFSAFLSYIQGFERIWTIRKGLKVNEYEYKNLKPMKQNLSNEIFEVEFLT